MCDCDSLRQKFAVALEEIATLRDYQRLSRAHVGWSSIDHTHFHTRFWSLVDRTSDASGCWLWLGGKDSKGYGRLYVLGHGKWRNLGAHRISWQLKHGEATSADLVVRHACDNRACVNPDHLSLGTQMDNVHDMHERGRANMDGLRGGGRHSRPCSTGDSHWTRRLPSRLKRGELHPNSKMTTETVRLIHALRRDGMTTTEIAARIGVSKTTVKKVVRGRAWAHVDNQ